MESITPTELHQRLQTQPDLTLLDVRSPAEHARLRVPGTRLIPLDNLDPAALRTSLHPDTPLHVLCHSGARARTAIHSLEKAGFTRCILVEGGTAAWAQAGLPVESSTSAGLSIERQMRVLSGTLGLTGTLLGLTLHPAWFALPLFAGAGLLFAGLTDLCPMASLVARMPWNQQRPQLTSCNNPHAS